MPTPTTYSRRTFFMPNPRSWIVFSVSILFLVGLPVKRAESGTSPSITLSASKWTPIGPAPVNRPFAGRIDVAAPDPSNPNVMYLGANNGGIWKTTNWSDSSPTWTEITDKPQILSLAVHEHDLVVFPGNPNIILAAASGPGGGIMRSDDAGSTWSYLANSRFDLAEFGALVVDPNVANAQTLYVAISGGSVQPNSGSGLFKSTDGGATWSATGSGTFSGLVTDLLQIQENGTTVLYAADPGNGDVYRSADGGASWSATHLPAGANPWESIRLAGSTAPTEKIYVAAIDNSNHDGLAGVVTRFVTPDKGAHWSTLTWPEAPGADNPGQSHRDHHNVLAVDPANSSTLFVNTDLEANLQTHNPDGTEKYTEFIWKSGDSGQTWQAAAQGVGGDPVSGSFDGTGVFVATGDGGVFHGPVNVYDNRGGNLNTIEFYGFSLDPSNPRMGFGLFQDGPGVLKYVGMVDWQYSQPPGGQGESGKIRVDPTNSNRVYYLDPNTAEPVTSPTGSARFVHSDDGGNTWTAAITGLPTHLESGKAITNYASFPGKGSIVIDPNTPKRLLLGLARFVDQNNVTTPASVFETTSGGDPNTTDPKFGGNGWRNIGSNLGNNTATISAIALAPSDSNTIFAGTEDGHVFKTANAGNANPSWTEVDSGLPLQDQRIMDLEISPTNPDYDFAVTSPFMGRDDKAPNFSGFFHVWVRNGAGWSQINGNLPKKLGGETLAVDWQPATPVLYVGTLRGAYKSTDLGANWNRMTSLPRTRVTDLDFMPSLHLLGAGTIGWGAWEILTQSTPPTVTPPASQMSVEGSSHLFGLGSFSDPDGGPWSVDVAWGDGTPDTMFSVTSAGPLPSKNHTYAEEGPYTVTIAVTDTLDGQSDSKTFPVNVSDPDLTDVKGGKSFAMSEGGPTNVSGALASFNDPGGFEAPAKYSATIDWGDGGGATPVAVDSSGGLATGAISASHTYAKEEGSFTITVTVQHLSNNTSLPVHTVTDTVTISDPAVNATGGFIFNANVSMNTGPQPVAKFTDPAGAEPNAADPAGTSANHYSAKIDWGDGTNSPGVITPLTPGSPTQEFTVTGNHTYTMESPVSGFNVITTIDHEGVTSMATSTAIVGRAGKVTGGGKIGDNRNFDFEAQPGSNNGFKGNLNYTDKTNNIDLKSTSITFVSILSDNAHATFNGTATVNGTPGYTFRVDMEDNGEPGNGVDRFRIRLSGPTTYDSNAFAANGGLLTSGNIQAHK